MSAMHQLEYLPFGADPKSDRVTGLTERIHASVWCSAPGGGYWVIPLDGGPRRLIRVRMTFGVYREWRE